MNFDFGMRRGEVMEQGEEANVGPGEDILGDQVVFRIVEIVFKYQEAYPV